MSLEDIEKELYGQRSRTAPQKASLNGGKKTPPSSQSKEAVPVVESRGPWEEVYNRDMKKRAPMKETRVDRTGRKIVIFLSVVLIGLLGMAGFYLYQYFTTKDVSLTATVPDTVLVGQPFSVSFSFENLSKQPLVAPRLSLALPDNAFLVDDTSKRVVDMALPDVAPGDIVKRDFSVVITGSSFSTYQFNGDLSYSYGASSLSSRFDKKVSTSVIAKDSVVSLDISAPDKVFSGQDFEIHVHYQNVGTAPVQGTVISMTFPQGFNFENADPALQQNTLTIPSLAPQQEGTIIIAGSMVAPEYSYFTIQASVKAQVQGMPFEIASKSISSSINSSPLVLHITANTGGGSGTDQSVYPGESLSYTLTFTNNSSTTLSDVHVSAQLQGPLFDVASYSGSGYMNDQTQTIDWTAAATPILASLAPQQSGSVTFKINLKTTYDTSLPDAASAVVQGTATSPTIPPGVTASQTIGVDRLEQTVGGSLGADAFAYFNEPLPDITNTGSLPPHVGVPVQYTIHWKVSPAGSDFSPVSLQATLAPGVVWTGKVKVLQAQEALVYDAGTQQVSWNIAHVTAGTSPEAIFQVEFTPPSNAIGGPVPLVSAVTVTGTDARTGKVTTLTTQPITSNTLRDSTLPNGYGSVIQ